MDINQLLAQFTGASQQQMGQVDQQMQRMEQDTARIQGLLTTNEAEAAELIQASAQAAGQEAQVIYQAAKAKEAYTAIAGMNPEDANNQFVQSVAAYDESERVRQELEQQRAGLMRKAEGMASVNLLDNPLEYLFAQLALPTVAAQHNSVLNQEVEVTQRRDSASRNIAARAEMIRQKDSLIAVNSADTVLEINTAKAKNATRAAQIELRQATADNISKIGARSLDMYRLGSDKFNIQSDLLNKGMQLEQWKLQREAAAAAAADRKEAAALRTKDAKDKDEMEAILNERLAAASYALGYKEPFTVLSIKLLDKDKQDNLVSVAMSGQFGQNLPSALTTVRNSGQLGAIVQTNPGMGKGIEYLANGLRSYADVVTREITLGKLPKNTDVAKEAGTAYEFELASSMGQYTAPNSLSSAKWDANGVFNPYKPQYLVLADQQAGGKLPELDGNVALAAVTTLRSQLGPNDNNLRGKDMQNLVGSLVAQVAKGSVPLDVAARDLASLHQVAAAKNLQMFNYTQLGLPQQTSAIVSLPPVTAFGNPYKMDLMNPADVKLNLAKMVREQRVGAIGLGMESSFQGRGITARDLFVPRPEATPPQQ